MCPVFTIILFLLILLCFRAYPTKVADTKATIDVIGHSFRVVMFVTTRPDPRAFYCKNLATVPQHVSKILARRALVVIAEEVYDRN